MCVDPTNCDGGCPECQSEPERQSFREWFDEERHYAKERADEDCKDAHNSYGAGYSSGYLEALDQVMDKLMEHALTELRKEL